ncbi:hypothetical protein KC571_04005 [candidate division WWE3 bacterium]|uniref:Uncharacterized protein n=1 Tax=candidate division WWE3 bacterium TaxID=2053526 RepID=A0A955LHQ8_UNCKA|nr:hypothetical protein [candidate division WWE3 bacterium]
MNSSNTQTRQFILSSETIIAIVLIVLGVILRLVPHPPNVAPITAIALLGGAKLGKRSGVILVMSIMLISDLLLGIHGSMLYTWGSFLAITYIGQLVLQNRSNPLSIFSTALASSLLFFLVTNFGVWREGTMYAQNLSGLLQSYTMAIPFYRNTVLGDLIYTPLFFGAYQLLNNYFKQYSLSFSLPFLTLKNHE